MRGRILAALVPALLLSACGGPEVPLEELRQQAENGACVLSVDADVEAGRDTWMGFYEAAQAGEDAEVTLVYWYHGDPHGHSRQDSCYTNRLSFEEGVYTRSQRGRRMRSFWSSTPACSALRRSRTRIPERHIRK